MLDQIVTLLLLLIVTSLFLPATSIMYTSGSPENSDESDNPLRSNITPSNNTGNAQVDLATSILAVHNQERAEVGVPPLTWNDTLAADAQVYADYFAATGKFEYPTAEWVAAHPMSPEGENLAAAAGSETNGTKLAGLAELWVGEKPLYHGQPIPAALAPG